MALVLVASAEGAAAAGPRVARAILPGGTRILVVRDRTAPVVSARAVWPGGTRLERAASAGLTRLMTESWSAGCGRRGPGEVDSALERTGSAMWGIAGRDSVELAAEWPIGSWSAGLTLLADCAAAPRFAAAAVDRARRRLLAERAARERSADATAWRLLVEILHGPAAYGADPLGSPDSLDAIDREQIAAHHRDAYPVGAMALAVVGDVSPDQVIESARKAFGGVKGSRAFGGVKGSRALGGVKGSRAFGGVEGSRGQGVKGQTGSPVQPLGERQVFRFLGGEVSALALGFPGVAVSHPDRAGLDVLAEVLAARLEAKLRQERGLVHRVSAVSIEGVEAGFVAVAIACRAERTAGAAAALRGEIDRLRTAGPSPDELVRAVRALRLREQGAAPAALASALATDEALGTASGSAGRRSALGRMRVADLAGLAARTLIWDRAVLATVMPPSASPEAARRARGSVRRPAKKKRRR